MPLRNIVNPGRTEEQPVIHDNPDEKRWLNPAMFNPDKPLFDDMDPVTVDEFREKVVLFVNEVEELARRGVFDFDEFEFTDDNGNLIRMTSIRSGKVVRFVDGHLNDLTIVIIRKPIDNGGATVDTAYIDIRNHKRREDDKSFDITISGVRGSLCEFGRYYLLDGPYSRAMASIALDEVLDYLGVEFQPYIDFCNHEWDDTV